MALDLDPYVKKLLNARRRVVLVNNILQNAQVGAPRGWGGGCSIRGGRSQPPVLMAAAPPPPLLEQERLRRLNHSVAKETVRRKAMLEAAGGYPQGLSGK